jgi:hypothetical protein
MSEGRRIRDHEAAAFAANHRPIARRFGSGHPLSRQGVSGGCFLDQAP